MLIAINLDLLRKLNFPLVSQQHLAGANMQISNERVNSVNTEVLKFIAYKPSKTSLIKPYRTDAKFGCKQSSDKTVTAKRYISKHSYIKDAVSKTVSRQQVP